MTPEPAYIELSTSRGIKFLIDIDDYPRVRYLSWCAHEASDGIWYITTAIPFTDADGYRKQRHIGLARWIADLEPGDPLEVDHINGDPRDNRKINLRVCPHAENMLNRRMHRNNTSGFKGATQVGPDRWAAHIAFRGRCYYLGVFDSPEKAHQAYCEAALWLHREFANFGEVRDEHFRLAVFAPPAAMPLALAGGLRKRKTQAARAGLGVWGTTPGPWPSFVANHDIFS